MLESIILLAVIGLCKAWSDTIAHHQSRMRFNTRWFRSVWDDTKYHLGKFKLDAWHVFENIMIAIILYLSFDGNYFHLVLNALAYWAAFELFYRYILVKK